ncbi:MAG: prepilin-type N-terminal cleavage/methylation domain-containing protein, partial [Clostridium sp.]|nr:prepilin-type N-terminal cleavage/methylation domain-containing protein [Clostridium sp.]
MLNRKGFTLIEVIVSIALIGLIAIAFLPALANHFKWIVDTRTKITQSAFQSQLEVEKNTNIIKERISELTLGGKLDSSKYASLGITKKIDKIKLFEAKYPITTFPNRIYTNAYQVESKLNASRKFVSWIGDKRLPELVVPEIRVDSLSFLKEGAQASGNFEYANYPALKIKSLSNMFKNPENSFNRYRHDWYVSNPGFIIPVPDAAYIDEDFDMGRIYPSFPEDYNPIPIVSELASSYAYVSATERTIEGYLANSHMQQDNPGRHIAYTITPFAKSLKKGNISTILPLYVYGPKNTTNLVLHLDASVISLEDTNSIERESDILYLKNWKNTRSNLKTPNTSFN